MPIPSSSSREVIREAHSAHLRAAHEAAPLIVAPPRAPKALEQCAQRMAARGSAATSELRDKAFARFLVDSDSLRSESQALLGKAPSHVRSVLGAASPLGPHPALLRSCLESSNYHDMAVVSDLLEGFPLVGEIPVDPLVESKTVRSITLDQKLLEELGPRRFSHMIRRQRSSFTKASMSDLQEVFDQTLGEVELGRMSPLLPLSESPHSLITRRFPVEQVDSKGRRKVRSVGDFAESRVNDSCSVSRRIRMGRLSDLLVSPLFFTRPVIMTFVS